MDLSNSYKPLQQDIGIEIKQEPVSPPGSDIEEEEYVTSDVYRSPHFPHLTIKKEEPTSSPEASPSRSPAFKDRDAGDHAAEAALPTPKESTSPPPPRDGPTTTQFSAMHSSMRFAYTTKVRTICSAASESSSDSSHADSYPTVQSHDSDVSPSEEDLLSSSGSDDEGATPQKRARREDSDWIKGDYSPSVFPFDAINSGLVDSLTLPPHTREVEYFKLFFDEELVSEIVAATNEYANKVGKPGPLQRSRPRLWQDTNVSELYCFLAVVFLMGLVQKNTIRDYWSTDTMLETPFFHSMFSVKRFCLLLRVLHFSSLTNAKDRLRSIRPTMEKIKERFAAFFVPFKNLSINESLMAWRGRHSPRQCIPSKRHRSGVKMFVLRDIQTGYILRFIVYAGATTAVTVMKKLGFTGSITVELLRAFLDKGHSLFVGDWCTSPALFKFLLGRQTNACGVVRANRKGLPEFAKLQRGKVDSYHSNAMLALKWRDRQDVHILSTMHGTELAEAIKVDKRTVETPRCILEYNQKMALVDKIDTQPNFSESIRKTMRWNKAVFFHLVDLSLHNAFILFRENTASRTTFVDFKRQVVSQLIEEHHTEKSKRRRPTGDNPLRLTGRHFAEQLRPSSGQGIGTHRSCHVCANTTRGPKRRRETRYMCVKCNKSLCLEPCFKEYHTLKNY
nr:piggyBac transposable element-derived protein 4-like isoform X1 [Rhipicephalus microplus]